MIEIGLSLVYTRVSQNFSGLDLIGCGGGGCHIFPPWTVPASWFFQYVLSTYCECKMWCPTPPHPPRLSGQDSASGLPEVISCFSLAAPGPWDLPCPFVCICSACTACMDVAWTSLYGQVPGDWHFPPHGSSVQTFDFRELGPTSLVSSGHNKYCCYNRLLLARLTLLLIVTKYLNCCFVFFF